MYIVCMFVFILFFSTLFYLHVSICPLSQLLEWATTSGAPQDRIITFFHLTKRYSIVQVQYKYSTSTVQVQYKYSTSTSAVQYSTLQVHYIQIQYKYIEIDLSTVQVHVQVQYSTIQVLYVTSTVTSTVQYSTSTVQYSTVQYSTV